MEYGDVLARFGPALRVERDIECFLIVSDDYNVIDASDDDDAAGLNQTFAVVRQHLLNVGASLRHTKLRDVHIVGEQSQFVLDTIGGEAEGTYFGVFKAKPGRPLRDLVTRIFKEAMTEATREAAKVPGKEKSGRRFLYRGQWYDRDDP